MVEHILSLALRGAEQAEVYSDEGETQSVDFENNQLKYITTRQHWGVGVRVIREGRLGFSSTTDMGALDSMVASALESARFGEKARFELPSPSEYPAVKTFDPAVRNVTIEQAAQMGGEAIERVLSAYPDVKCGAGIEKAVGRARLTNSCGLDLTVEATMFSYGIEAFRLRGESFLWSGDGNSARQFRSALNEAADRTIQLIRQSETEIALAPGNYTVVFSTRAAHVLLECLVAAVNGKAVQKGMSPLRGRIGEGVLGREMTITDDPTVHFADGSGPWDGEGLPGSPTPLFEAGVLRNYLLDLQTAGLLGMKPTGNANRSHASQPRPGASNIIVRGGDTPYASMLAHGKVILVERLLGAGQSNTLAGEFAGNIDLGFLIENGTAVGRVKNCMVAGNVYDLFRRVGAVSRETEWHGALCTPAFLFEALPISSRQG